MACLWTGLLQSLHVDHKLIHKRFLLNCQANQGSVDQTCTPARNTAAECPLSALSLAPFESEIKSLLCLSMFEHFSLLLFLTTIHSFLTWATPLPVLVPPLMPHQSYAYAARMEGIVWARNPSIQTQVLTTRLPGGVLLGNHKSCCMHVKKNTHQTFLSTPWVLFA